MSIAVALTTSNRNPKPQRHRRQSGSTCSPMSDESFISSMPAADEKLRRGADVRTAHTRQGNVAAVRRAEQHKVPEAREMMGGLTSRR